jgi:hypothetical protein
MDNEYYEMLADATMSLLTLNLAADGISIGEKDTEVIRQVVNNLYQNIDDFMIGDDIDYSKVLDFVVSEFLKMSDTSEILKERIVGLREKVEEHLKEKGYSAELDPFVTFDEDEVKDLEKRFFAHFVVEADNPTKEDIDEFSRVSEYLAKKVATLNIKKEEYDSDLFIPAMIQYRDKL